MMESIEIKNHSNWWEYSIDSNWMILISWTLWDTSWISETNKVFPTTKISSSLKNDLEIKKLDWYQIIWETNDLWKLSPELSNFLESDNVQDHILVENIVLCRIKYSHNSSNVISNITDQIQKIVK